MWLLRQLNWNVPNYSYVPRHEGSHGDDETVHAREPPETVDLADFLADLKRDMLDEFELETSAPLRIRLRPHAMRRALRNIIENAVRWGVAVRYSQEHDRVVIEVRHHGPGIPSTQLESVFEPFYRVETSGRG